MEWGVIYWQEGIVKLNPDQLYGRWEGQIDILYNQGSSLVHIDDVFWELQAIVRESERLREPETGVFFE